MQPSDADTERLMVTARLDFERARGLNNGLHMLLPYVESVPTEEFLPLHTAYRTPC